MGTFSFPSWEENAEEQSLRARLNAEEVELNARLNYFSLSSSNASAQQIKGYIDELNSFLGRFSAWRPMAAKLKLNGHDSVAQKLEGLIERVQYNLQTYSYTYSSRSAFERFQYQQSPVPGPYPPSGSYPSYGVPASGGPERFQAVLGMRCYWCQGDLAGMPQPVGVCPYCGRFPAPPPA
ncbi:MAG: hypothetical protein ACLPKI_08390 [Streptosporangiaceae bacterium]